MSEGGDATGEMAEEVAAAEVEATEGEVQDVTEVDDPTVEAVTGLHILCDA